MTREDSDDIRARASMLILAAMYTNRVTTREPREPEQLERYQRQEDRRRMLDAMHAVSAANALVAELQLHEQAIASALAGAPQWPIHDGVPDGGAMPDGHVPVVRPGETAPLGANVLSCSHGRSSLEDCPECDAADAAEKAGKTGEDGENRQG
jgi:hypothetical protein